MTQSIRFRPAQAAFWAATWAVGVAVGVGLGGWLTVIGGAGAPGTEALSLTEDLIQLPLAAAAITFSVHFLGQAVAFVVRSRHSTSDPHEQHEYREAPEDEDVDR